MPSPLAYLPLHFLMDPKTVEMLREAAINALHSKEDVAAAELLSLLNSGSVQLPVVQEPPALPQGRELIEGPAHEYQYWMRFIREQFIPFMSANGRMRFTSHELLAWLENCEQLTLTTGDMEDSRNDGRPVWRQGVTLALSNLKQQGIVNAPPFSKEYQIIRQIAPALGKPALATLRRIPHKLAR